MEENQADEQEDEQSLSFSVDHFANWQELVASGAISVPRTRTRRGLAPLRPKAKRRKNQDLAGDCGGRVIRSDGRKDRHSKVCTARGTRDRRVRLSPETAILFYDVQDRLGYDRPSKAIDWLMREAKAAIDSLENDPPPPPADGVCFASAGFMGSCSGVPVNLEIQQIGPEDNAGLSNNGGFGFIADEYQQAFSPLAPLTVSSDGIFEANMELGKMQRIFAWNYANGSLPDHFAGPAPSMMGRGQISREPLPSNYSRIADNHYPMSPRFPIFDFSDDPLPDFTTPEENDVGNLYKIPVSGEQSSPASFLHYEE